MVKKQTTHNIFVVVMNGFLFFFFGRAVVYSFCGHLHHSHIKNRRVYVEFFFYLFLKNKLHKFQSASFVVVVFCCCIFILRRNK